MSDIAMRETKPVAESVTERARQQGRRLRALRERTGVSKGRLMDQLGFRTNRALDLYEEGVSVIRTDRLADWAGAFGLTVQQFVAEVITVEPDQGVTMTAFSVEREVFERQLDDLKLPDDVRAEILKGFEESVRLQNGTSELARRN